MFKNNNCGVDETRLLIMKKKAARNFISGIYKTADLCWLWTKFADGNGYPIMRAYGKRVYAHRFILEYQLGASIPANAKITRNCGNKLCVNPNHLKLKS